MASWTFGRRCGGRNAPGQGRRRLAGGLVERPPLVFDTLEPRLLLNADILQNDVTLNDPAGTAQSQLVRLIDEAARGATRAEAVQRVEQVPATGSPGEPGAVLQASGVLSGGAAARPVLTGTEAELVIRLSDGADRAVLRNHADDGYMELVAEGHLPLPFRVPEISLTVDLGAGEDRLEILSLDPAFAAALSVEGSGGRDVVVLGGPIATGGGDLRLDAATVRAGTTLDTVVFAGDWTTAEPAAIAGLAAQGGAGNGMIADVVVGEDGRLQLHLVAAGAGYAAGDALSFEGPDGRSVTATVASVGNGVEVTTRGADGAAGDIIVEAGWIDIGAGVTLDTTGAEGVAGADGAIRLEAKRQLGATGDPGEDVVQMIVQFLGFGGGGQTAGLSVSAATLTGGTVALQAGVNDDPLEAITEAGVPTWVSGFIGNLGDLLQQGLGVALSQIGGIDVSVMVRSGAATVSLHDVTLTASDTVTIDSSAAVAAETSALTVTRGAQPGGGSGGGQPRSPFQLAAGFARGDGRAETLISGATDITAAGSVRIGADASVAAGMTATASNVQDAQRQDDQQAEGDAVSVALAIANADLVSRVHLGTGATVTSQRGNVDIRAEGDSSASVSASVSGFVRGKAGLTAALGFEFATVRTLIEGTVMAAGAPAGAEARNFNPTAAGVVDTTLNRIRIPGHGFAQGREVVYTPGKAVTGGIDIEYDPIGGLKADESYFVRVVDADTIELARAPTIALDSRGTDPDAVQTLRLAAMLPFVLDAVDESDGTLRMLGTGFAPGDQVIYENTGSGNLGGLTAGQTYRLWLADDEFIGLETLDGTRVHLTQDGALGTHSFFRAASPGSDELRAQVTLGLLDAEANLLRLAGHGLADGQEVAYDTLGAPEHAIEGLDRDVAHVVERIDADSFRLRIGTGGPVAELRPAAEANTHMLAFEDRALAFAPVADVDAAAGTIHLPGHGLETGDTVIYAVDPTKERVITRATLNADGTPGPETDITVTDPALRGLVPGGLYVAVVVDADRIRLAPDLATAAAAAPIALSDGADGDLHRLGARPEVSGIGAEALLAASNSASAAPSLGDSFTPQAFFSDGITADNMISGLLQRGNLFDRELANKQGDLAQSFDDLGWQAAGALALNFGKHDVTAELKGARLTSGADIGVRAEIEQAFSTGAIASVSVPDGSDDTAVALGIAVTPLINTARAIVGADSVLLAEGDIAVSAHVIYPLAEDPDDLADPDTWLANGLERIRGLTGELGGFLSFFNVTAKAVASGKVDGATGGGTDGLSVSGGIALNRIETETEARIDSGARVNEGRAASGAVTVEAETEIKLLARAGNLSGPSLDSFAGDAIYDPAVGSSPDRSAAIFSRAQAAEVFKRGNLLGKVFSASTSGGAAIGGMVVFDWLVSDTRALVNPGAVIRAPGSDVTVRAREDVFTLGLATAGGQVSGEGFNFAGSGRGLLQLSTVEAGLNADGTAGVGVTAGTLSVTAEADMIHVGVAGTLVIGGTGNAVGISVGVNVIERDTAAWIGQRPEREADGVPRAGHAAAVTTLAVGSLDVGATARGGAFSFAIAGSARTGEDTQGGGAQDGGSTGGGSTGGVPPGAAAEARPGMPGPREGRARTGRAQTGRARWGAVRGMTARQRAGATPLVTSSARPGRRTRCPTCPTCPTCRTCRTTSTMATPAARSVAASASRARSPSIS